MGISIAAALGEGARGQGGAHALRHHGRGGPGFVEAAPRAQRPSELPVARQPARAGEHEVPEPGQAGEGLGAAPLRHRQPRHLGQAAGDEGGLGVLAVAEPVHDPGRDGDDVLEGGRELGPHQVVARVGADGLGGEHALHRLRPRDVRSRHHHRRGLSLGHLEGEARARRARRRDGRGSPPPPPPTCAAGCRAPGPWWPTRAGPPRGAARGAAGTAGGRTRRG